MRFCARHITFAVDMNWLPATVIPRRQWPAIHYKEKRAITLKEHQKIIGAEANPEWKTLYKLCWHLGASQGDIANLKGEDVDWSDGTVSFIRKKTGVPVLVHLGAEALTLFNDLPAEGVLFPYLSRVRAGDRATEFGQRCRLLGIADVQLQMVDALDRAEILHRVPFARPSLFRLPASPDWRISQSENAFKASITIQMT